MIYRPITIDCTKDNLKRIKVTNYEHGAVMFVFTVLNDNRQIDLSECKQAVFYGTKSDGHLIGNACSLKDNKVMLSLSLQMTTAPGILEGIIELQFDTGSVRFYGVNFEVFAAPETAEIESIDEFTLLEQKIAEVQKIIDEGIETSQGKSAYDIAVDNGFEGSEAEWLESLKGKNGADGKDGANGLNGKDGHTPIKGIDYFTDSDKQSIVNEMLSNFTDVSEVGL